jgi:hypothetical protein
MASHPDYTTSNPRESQIELQQLAEMLLSLQDRLGQIEYRQTHQTPQRSTTVSHLPDNVKLPKPSTYHGNPNRVDSWIYELELYFANLGVPESRKVGLAVSFLRDSALMWW